MGHVLDVRLAVPHADRPKTIVFHVSQGGTFTPISASKSVRARMDINTSLLQRTSAQYLELSAPLVMI